MACKTSYELHHHFPKLAEESGFAFNTHRPRIHIDWNKIRLIDIENMIRERKFVVVEEHLNDILDCVLESEFDVRILDEGVLKMFRLAQLAVEYQQFCRHYLDRSVYVLRQEVTSLAQELGTTKRNLQEKEDEIRRLKKRTKHSYKTPLPYGNDNIATMILKTLSNRGDIFPSASDGDIAPYNKCNYCDKVFLNQLYLKSHITRRHANVTELPLKETVNNDHNNENAKLSSEITELKSKLIEMETKIAKSDYNDHVNKNAKEVTTDTAINDGIICDVKKVTEDAKISSTKEDYLLNKLEEWKKEEHDKYNKEINTMRNQIMETINSLKEKELQQPVQRESKIIEQLNATITQQGTEILALKQELNHCKTKTASESLEKTKEAETQILLWTQRAESQTKQYDLLLQKLSDVAKDAKESRTLAEFEKERAAQLQSLLEQTLSNQTVTNVDTGTDPLETHSQIPNGNVVNKKAVIKQLPHKIHTFTDRQTLENLHRKAQELLNIGSSSSSSDLSSSDKVNPIQTKSIPIQDLTTRKATAPEHNKTINKQTSNHAQRQKKAVIHETQNAKEPKNKRHPKIVKADISSVAVPGSPMKVVRAKLTEEVNNRLVSAGVDPLKSRITKYVYQKQRMQLQRQQELKSKKNPAHEKVRHSILTYLDASTTDIHKEARQSQEYISPSKGNKPHRSLTSVLSGVKSKALALVKMNDAKDKRKSLNAEVAKRASVLIKNPLGSATSSPENRHSPEKINAQVTKEPRIETKTNKYESALNKVKNSNSANKSNLPQTNAADAISDSSDESSESEHKYYTPVVQQSSRSIENLIKSPARRPTSANTDYKSKYVSKYTLADGDLTRTQSVTNLTGTKTNETNKTNNSSSNEESVGDFTGKKASSVENIQVAKQTRGVLKNASSTSSLNKKKVLFDMDAIQMKSVSASPSQSVTEKSDNNEKYGLGLVNLDGEEWDISSIENEPLKIDTKIQTCTRTSPKIAELKRTIESQLSRRNETPPTRLAGGVDVLGLGGLMTRAASTGGSNTSLGSSILDESETIPATNNKAFVKPKKVAEKDDSELDISEFSIDGIANKNESF